MYWILGRAQTFLKGLRESPHSCQDSLDHSLYFIQRYLLEISQDVGHFAHSSTDSQTELTLSHLNKFKPHPCIPELI